MIILDISSSKSWCPLGGDVMKNIDVCNPTFLVPVPLILVKNGRTVVMALCVLQSAIKTKLITGRNFNALGYRRDKLLVSLGYKSWLRGEIKQKRR